MVKKLADSRKMTLEDADVIIRELAKKEVEVIKIAARYERKINQVKENCIAESADLVDGINSQAEKLRIFIDKNPNLFITPRSRKTTFGQYGKRTVSNLDLKDENAVIRYAKKLKLKLFTTKEKVDKNAVKAALNAGKSIPGAKIKRGEEIFYSIDKKLISNAKKNITS